MQHFDRADGTENAILVHLDIREMIDPDDLEEFRLLVHSAGANELDIITGTRSKPHAKYFVGTGKAEEIAQKVTETNADIVLFNHKLTPSQERNLEKILQCRVVDRMGLILDIFAKRARTYEGKLQVELAQLTHLSSRLVRGYAHLGQQKGGIGLRGPGETQLETDRRLLQVRVNQLKAKLAKVKQTRLQGRAKRQKSDTPTISLVGYTNAGKSTLFNRLANDNVYAANQLFATLDPTLRRVKWTGVGNVVLADTVGFVRHLPHELVESFHATLQETLEADLLLHVIDSSSPDMHEQIDAVNAVLDEIGATAPVLLVYNKIDRTDEMPTIHYKELGVPHRVYVSARENLGMDKLAQAVQELLVGGLSDFTLTLPYHAGQFKNTLHELGVITHSEFDDTGHEILTVRLAKAKLKELLGRYHLNAFDVLPPHEASQFVPELEEFEKVAIKVNDDKDEDLDPFCL
ncbi:MULTISPECIES: ribosome rescue GTPase HflX [Moraxella]|uniref:GTPase HflX n=1 Tax=Moraxella lacunata TaxID=477 RepID=A0A1B8PWJ3_MORLA|nr:MULTISPECIES: ribosome rescue GTPase HflX [Moraxella]MBE9577735.1 GTPase HflX [Moraxella sp. K1664]MBE9587157.1 GTPase HflX [Moraxella sp. K1630]MBE9595441.1 GTPase HflX [Moraxella sp. K2450]MDH9217900.1 GTPase HflX [Moraxella lacunata]MDI4483311.1 GTPase HflX [Moraxella lacunata]